MDDVLLQVRNMFRVTRRKYCHELKPVFVTVCSKLCKTFNGFGADADITVKNPKQHIEHSSNDSVARIFAKLIPDDSLGQLMLGCLSL